MKDSLAAKRFLLFVLFNAFTFLACAGGGTSGTGLKTFSGVARTPSGMPVAGVEIAVAGTDSQSVTSDDGRYQFQAELGAGSVQVDVANEGQTNSVEVSGLPEGDAEVTIDIAVDEETRAATAISVDVQSRSDQNPPADSGTDMPSEEDTGSGSGETPSPSPRLTLISGVLLDAEGLPLAGVRVFSEALGLSVVTDEFGMFSIEGLIESERLALSFGEDQSSIETEVELSEDTSSVSLVLQENQEEDGSSSIATEITDIEFREDRDPTANPTPEEDIEDPEPTGEENPGGSNQDDPTNDDGQITPPVNDLPNDGEVEEEEEEEAEPDTPETPAPETPGELEPDLPGPSDPGSPDVTEEEEFAP